MDLYDISQAPLLVGTLQASGQIARVRFRGRQLWVLDKNQSMVEVFEVIDPAAPMRIGAISGLDIGEIWALYWGTRRFAFHGNLVSAYRLEPVDP